MELVTFNIKISKLVSLKCSGLMFCWLYETSMGGKWYEGWPINVLGSLKYNFDNSVSGDRSLFQRPYERFVYYERCFLLSSMLCYLCILKLRALSYPNYPCGKKFCFDIICYSILFNWSEIWEARIMMMTRPGEIVK